ncbi:hypothetical protein TNIN_91981 [Trichonephila inaurata madagascariensis]|uniref:Uncharacterized protein n=1 Tax=Trichonephila inaurata madagascariensis TaxID=2747483 RepID=A0A8X6XH67_9ARAC|nr:hypothetical protein TNIN_91981 [Trichonephila inaurata madagascariensis]
MGLMESKKLWNNNFIFTNQVTHNQRKNIKEISVPKKQSEEMKNNSFKKAISFNDWLAQKHNFQRPTWSYGFDGGVLISYYDNGSITRPSFCNPNPWIS